MDESTVPILKSPPPTAKSIPTHHQFTRLVNSLAFIKRDKPIFTQPFSIRVTQHPQGEECKLRYNHITVLSGDTAWSYISQYLVFVDHRSLYYATVMFRCVRANSKIILPTSSKESADSI